MATAPKPRFWNIWWTLTMISAGLTLIALALEALGILDDLGLATSLAGLLPSLIFGLSASTRSSLTEFRGEVTPRLDQIASRLGQLDDRLTGRLDGVTDRLDEVTGRLDRMNAHLEDTTGRLDRIITLLDERLPRPAV